MEESNKSHQTEAFKQRTNNLALRVFKLTSSLPHTEEASILRKQLFRSATSVVANYRAACRGRSDAETYSKIGIVLEEADETLLWLEFVQEVGFVSEAQIKPLSDECLEIVKITNSIRTKLKAKLDSQKTGNKYSSHLCFKQNMVVPETCC